MEPESSSILLEKNVILPISELAQPITHAHNLLL